MTMKKSSKMITQIIKFYHSTVPTYVDYDPSNSDHVDLARLIKKKWKHWSTLPLKDSRKMARLFLKVFGDPSLMPRTDVFLWSETLGHGEKGDSLPRTSKVKFSQ